MSFEIPGFSDDLAHCEQCGWADADTEYVPASRSPLDRINPFGGSWPPFGFLKRTCTRCGFQWAEAPLPRQQPEPEGCDVRSVSGARCLKHKDHFNHLTSPHQFPVPEQSTVTVLMGQGDCQGPCCGGTGPVNYDH